MYAKAKLGNDRPEGEPWPFDVSVDAAPRIPQLLTADRAQSRR
jgi:hypothetical protein